MLLKESCLTIIHGCDPRVYRVLDDHRRSILFKHESSLEPPLCDDLLPFGWYRFLAYGMPREMPTECPAPNSCGSKAQVWLDVGADILSTGNITVDACVSWGFGEENVGSSEGGMSMLSVADCCLFTLPVSIRNCGSFNVYYLGPTQACPISYCSAPFATGPHHGPVASEAVAKTTKATPQVPAGMASMASDTRVTKLPGPVFHPLATLEHIKPPRVEVFSTNGEVQLECKTHCSKCQISWWRKSGKIEEKVSTGKMIHLLRQNPLQFGDEIFCQITVNDGRTVKSKPWRYGYSLTDGKGQKVNEIVLRPPTYETELRLVQHLPIPCDIEADNCTTISLEISEKKLTSQHTNSVLSQQETGQSSKFLGWESCRISQRVTDCEIRGKRNRCNQLSLPVKVVNIRDPLWHFKDESGSLKLSVKTGDEELLLQEFKVDYFVMRREQNEFSDAKLCHLFTFGRIIGFHEQRMDLEPGIYKFFQSGEFAIEVVLVPCGTGMPGNNGCLSQLSIRHEDPRVLVVKLPRFSHRGFDGNEAPVFGHFGSGKEQPDWFQIRRHVSGSVCYIDLDDERTLRLNLDPDFGSSLTFTSPWRSNHPENGICTQQFAAQNRLKFEESLLSQLPDLVPLTINRIIGVLSPQNGKLCSCSNGKYESSASETVEHFRISQTEEAVISGSENDSSFFVSSLNFSEEQENSEMEFEKDQENALFSIKEPVMGSEEIFDLCTDSLVNSTIAKVCGRFYQHDIMKVMDICIKDVTLMRNAAWSVATLPLLASQCELSLLKVTSEWEEVMNEDGKVSYEPPLNLGKILNCQQSCHRTRGFCNADGSCVCLPGFHGDGCRNSTIADEAGNDAKRRRQICDLSTQECSIIKLEHHSSASGSSNEGSCTMLIPPKETITSLIVNGSCALSEEIIKRIQNNMVEMLELEIRVKDKNGHELYKIDLQIYDSRCRDPDDLMMLKKDICIKDLKCFQLGESNPKKPCEVCGEEGRWSILENTVPHLHKLTRYALAGEQWTYRVQHANFTLLSGPEGMRVNSEDMTLIWTPFLLDKNSKNETIVVLVEERSKSNGCEMKSMTEIILEIHVCECQNGGECRRNLGSPQRPFKCLCPLKYEGEFCEKVTAGCLSQPCRHGQCIQGDFEDEFHCLCGPGYTGRLCDEPVDLCQENPCFKGVECASVPGGYLCGACPENFTGDGINCHLLDPCLSNPCHPRVVCQSSVDKPGEFACGPCPYKTRGNGITCDPYNPCASNPCYRDVSCFPLGEDFICANCPAGMTGNGIDCHEIFDETNLCAFEESNPCYDKTLCKQVGSTVTCTACPPGMKGDGINCEKVQEDLCAVENPCHPSSSCLAVNGILTCGPCPEDMTGNGKVCHSLDPCSHNPCHPEVTCTIDIESPEGFICGPCPLGLTGDGTDCQPVFDHCQPNPCFPDVTCVNQDDGFKCLQCPLGFAGDGMSCTHVLDPAHDPCGSNPCYQGVRCQPLSVESYECGKCPTGMTGNGTVCRKSPCQLRKPCFPGVACQDLSEDEFSCGDCPAGLTGDGISCKEPKDHCSSNPCYKGVQCYSFADKYKCGNCPVGFTGHGVKCTKLTQEDPCTPNPCFEGVQCAILWRGKSPSFTCGLCPEGMIGDGQHCSTTDPCFPNPCYLGSVCVPHHESGSYECGPCPKGFIGNGKECIESGEMILLDNATIGSKELNRNPKIDEDDEGEGQCRKKCENGGHCIGLNKCSCPEGYRGRFCHKPKCNGGCRNGGKCIGPNQCQCKEGFHGQNCRRASCSPPCQNGGKCRKSRKRCKCKRNFYGKRCEKFRFPPRIGANRKRMRFWK